MKDAATIKMLQELGAFILAGGNGEKGVNRMAEMFCAGRGWRWVGIYKLSRGELNFIAGSDNDPPCYRRFPATQGLCGAAAESRETVVALTPRSYSTGTSARKRSSCWARRAASASVNGAAVKPSSASVTSARAVSYRALGRIHDAEQACGPC